ncbi:5'/3'-nucleotidase SurE [Thermofilum pendens]|uniref:5'-nucleotidase SurE n=1 Tax=Thermofilum pendens (strain DSM 2475 / Hrk 5) TaxID=368408 RepID=SURE_THEPD|nr:5'/3'-nucleotidase SurE [Thermofilum pendens]A1RYX4.1 RecName: Full=5'-nucleotidase SurE; AltName: Full=Nucleoside 5'-monophosphate phosphohydrolase [Thermofilum pendens Hrk 5]ABL78404.1 5'-nucleotidase / exopolyphosphatase / 3'-nucleotidase [Thermofilum pendens Hrk 5]
MKILVTNDDGPFSPGLAILREAVRGLGEATVVVPETPKSATGLGLTLHKPLRVNRLSLDGEPVYLVSGTPSDVIYIAMNVISGKPDLVVSGVNIGDNLSVQVILTSGTLGAVLQASIEGVPGIAFSAAVDTPEELEEGEYRNFVLRSTKAIVRAVVGEGFPKGVDALNVNFPSVIASDVVVVRPALKRFSTAVVRRKDPQGRPYYWLYGHPVEAEEGSDVHAVLEEGKIAITPLSLSGMLSYSPEALSGIVKKVKEELSR